MLTLGFITSIGSTSYAAADTCTWTGATNNNWDNSGNWTGCDNAGIPENLDTVLFPANPIRTASNNNISSLTLAKIQIDGDNYSITGSSISIDQLDNYEIVFNGVNNDLGLDISYANPGNSTKIFNVNTNTISGAITFASSQVTVKANTGTLTFSGAIGGGISTLIAASGAGTVVYDHANTFTADDIQIDEGSYAKCSTATCFGDASNDVTLGYASRLTFIIPFPDTPYIANNIFLEAGTTLDTGNNNIVVIQGDVTLNGNATIDGTNANVTVDGITDLGSNTLVMTGGYQSSLNGKVTGTGNIMCNGCFTGLGLIGNNDYEGTTTVRNNGRLLIYKSNALGTTDGNTIIEEGSDLEFSMLDTNTVPVPENITISGAGGGVGGGAMFNQSSNSVYWSGTITLDGNATISQHDGGMFNLSGQITGTGDLTLLGQDAVSHIDFTGSGENDYEGVTNVNNVTLNVGGANDVISVPGDINIIADGLPAQVNDQSYQKISDTSRITMSQNNASAGLRIENGVFDTVGMIEGNGSLIIDSADQPFNVGGGDLSGTFAGSISAPETVIAKVGLGDWTLTGTLNANGGLYPIFQVQAGKFLFDWADNSGLHAPVILSLGTLGGTGTIGQINAQNGTIAPGNSPGCLNPTGPLILNSNITIDIQIFGYAACSELDELNVDGAIDLGGATLNLTTIDSFNPYPGDQIVPVSATSLTGTFAGLPDGSKVKVGAHSWRINYTSTTVNLTALPDPVSPQVIPAPSSTTSIAGLPVTGINIAATIIVAMLFIGLGFVLIRRRKSTIA